VDGKKIAFQLDPDDETPFSRDLWVMDEDGSNRINITNTEDLDEWQLWRHYSPAAPSPKRHRGGKRTDSGSSER
jgi:hypothetical protein